MRKGPLKGALLLVNGDVSVTWADLFAEYLRAPDIIERAMKAGAAAILWTSQRERLLLYRHTNTGDGALEELPQAIVAREDALRLSRLIAAHPGKIRARFTMNNKIGGPIEQENVVGEIRGYEKPDEVVLLGAHLDSWELGTGALDNGCNAAMVIEAARAIKATGLVPRRTIRFVLFSGEEEGMLGSWAYVKSHDAELDKIRAVVIFDSGVGRVTGYSLGGRHDMEDPVREALQPLNRGTSTGIPKTRISGPTISIFYCRACQPGGQPGSGQLSSELSCRVGHLGQGGHAGIKIKYRDRRADGLGTGGP